MADGTVPLELNDDHRQMLAGALESGHVVTVAYVDDSGYPQMSPRGSAQVLGPQQVAVWARSAEGGLPNAIGAHPEMSLLFMDFATRRVMLSFFGNGHIATDPATIDTVYANQPDIEKTRDPERKGVAIVVDLVRVVSRGAGPENNYVMAR